MNKKSINDVVAWKDVFDAKSQPVELPNPQYWTHVQFRRFTTCPMCNLHLRQYAKRYETVKDAGVRTIAVFSSRLDAVKELQAELPFILVSDPDENLYGQFCVEKSIMAILHPATIVPGIRGAIKHGMKIPKKGDRKLGLPADFLINTDGVIKAVKYGIHAYDQWSLDELLQILKRVR